MADTKNVATLGPYILRVQAGALFLANDIAQKIENMYPLEEGSLRTVIGPAAYVPVKETDSEDAELLAFRGKAGDRPFSKLATGIPTQDNTVPVYGQTQHGIYHALLQNGERDVLLLHTGDQLWEFRGWNQDWRQLLSNPASVHGRQAVLPDDTAVRFPTQFESTGNGIVIVPQGSQAYFYDGSNIVPLGFSQIPSAPQPRGPHSSAGSSETENTEDGSGNVTDVNATGKGINDISYAHDGTWFAKRSKLASGMTYGFGAGNLGTPFNATTSFTANTNDTTNVLAQTMGWLEPGEWRCKVQLVDQYGNLSALSGSS